MSRHNVASAYVPEGATLYHLLQQGSSIGSLIAKIEKKPATAANCRRRCELERQLTAKRAEIEELKQQAQQNKFDMP